MDTTHEITTSHFRYYVRDLKTGEQVGFFRSLKEAVKAYPAAAVNVPDAVKRSGENYIAAAALEAK